MLNTATVAQRLGFDRSSVGRLFREGRIPGAIRIGGVWRIHEDVLQQYLEQHTPWAVGRTTARS
jgi:excisionase family DNA binding protein